MAILGLDEAKANLESAAQRRDAAQWEANAPGARQEERLAAQRSREAYNRALDDFQRAKVNDKLQTHKAAHAEQEAAKDAERAKEFQARSDAAAAVLGAAAKRDEAHGRRPGESAQEWVNREIREKRALRTPGRFETRTGGPSIEAQNALDREGPGAAPAASTGAAPAASKAGRIPGRV